MNKLLKGLLHIALLIIIFLIGATLIELGVRYLTVPQAFILFILAVIISALIN